MRSKLSILLTKRIRLLKSKKKIYKKKKKQILLQVPKDDRTCNSNIIHTCKKSPRSIDKPNSKQEVNLISLFFFNTILLRRKTFHFFFEFLSVRNQLLFFIKHQKTVVRVIIHLAFLSRVLRLPSITLPK
jgi:hypothetical protein